MSSSLHTLLKYPQLISNADLTEFVRWQMSLVMRKRKSLMQSMLEAVGGLVCLGLFAASLWIVEDQPWALVAIMIMLGGLVAASLWDRSEFSDRLAGETAKMMGLIDKEMWSDPQLVEFLNSCRPIDSELYEEKTADMIFALKGLHIDKLLPLTLGEVTEVNARVAQGAQSEIKDIWRGWLKTADAPIRVAQRQLVLEAIADIQHMQRAEQQAGHSFLAAERMALLDVEHDTIVVTTQTSDPHTLSGWSDDHPLNTKHFQRGSV